MPYEIASELIVSVPRPTSSKTTTDFGPHNDNI